jgi:hypothetical protein
MKKKTGEPQNGGRPPSPEPTPEQRSQVETLAGFGLTQEQIATVVGVGEVQLRQRFAKELAQGEIKADIAVTQNLFKIATGSTPQAVSAAIFWKKVRSRWHEVQRVIHGYDPELVTGFVKQVIAILRRELPQVCPHCSVRLDLPQKVAAHLKEITAKMAERLPPSTIVPITRLDDGETPG